jgi:hypothetical protein
VKDPFQMLGKDIATTATIAKGRTVYLPAALVLVAERAAAQERARIRKALLWGQPRTGLSEQPLFSPAEIERALRAPRRAQTKGRRP